MTAQLDIDDVVADHPKAKAELKRLRALENAAKRVVVWLESTEASRAHYRELLELLA